MKQDGVLMALLNFSNAHNYFQVQLLNYETTGQLTSQGLTLCCEFKSVSRYFTIWLLKSFDFSFCKEKKKKYGKSDSKIIIS